MNALLRFRTPPCILALLLSFPAVCGAWGREGHRIVAEIAAENLSPDARRTVKTLLGEQSMADVSNWADEILRQQEWKFTRTFHYANVPPDEDEFVLKRDCPGSGCVVKAILDNTATLRSEDDPDKKAAALKFLIHFVGDIHQPLHVSYARDRGGNDIAVTFFEQKTNLHKAWDIMFIERKSTPWPKYARELAQRITPEMESTWKARMDVIEWANESYELATQNAYAVPKDGRIGQEYYDRNLPVVERRLSQAGIRLAALLNDVFTPTHDAAPNSRSNPRRTVPDKAQ